MFEQRAIWEQIESQVGKRGIMKIALFILFLAVTGVLTRADAQVRVYVHGAHGYKYVAGVDQWPAPIGRRRSRPDHGTR